MPENLPPATPPTPPPSTPPSEPPGDGTPAQAPPDDVFGPSALDEAPRTRRGCAGWVIGGLILLVIVLIGSVGLLIHMGVKSAQKALGGLNQPIPPATAPSEATFDELRRFYPPGMVFRMVAADVDGDDTSELIVMAEAEIIAYDADGKELERFIHNLNVPVASPGAGSPGGVGGRITSVSGVLSAEMLAATVDGETALIVFDTNEATVYVYRLDGTTVFEDTVTAAMVTCVGAFDLNGDGEDEIFIGRDSQMGLACLDGSGNELWKVATTTDPTLLACADGDGDGARELYVGSAYGTGVQVVDANGNPLTTWPYSASAESLASGDLNGDGLDEMVAVSSQAGMASGGGFAGAFQLGLVGLDPKQGGQLWAASLAGGIPMMADLRVVAADLDDDGTSEWVANATDGTVRAFDIQGTEIARQAFGQPVHAVVVAPTPSGEKPKVWVSVGPQIIELEWSKWNIPTALLGTP